MDEAKKTKGSLEVKPVPRSPHKLPLDALEEYVKEHPDAFLREIGAHLIAKKMQYQEL